MSAAALLFGIGLGGDYMIIPLMAADLYGLAVMGRVMGVVLTADSVAESLVPMLVATIRDRTGSYEGGFLVLLALAAAGAVAVSCLPRQSGGVDGRHEGGPRTGAAERAPGRLADASKERVRAPGSK